MAEFVLSCPPAGSYWLSHPHDVLGLWGTFDVKQDLETQIEFVAPCCHTQPRYTGTPGLHCSEKTEVTWVGGGV